MLSRLFSLFIAVDFHDVRVRLTEYGFQSERFVFIELGFKIPEPLFKLLNLSFLGVDFFDGRTFRQLFDQTISLALQTFQLTHNSFGRNLPKGGDEAIS